MIAQSFNVQLDCAVDSFEMRRRNAASGLAENRYRAYERRGPILCNKHPRHIHSIQSECSTPLFIIFVHLTPRGILEALLRTIFGPRV
jgi:hypothetical protein